MTRYKVVWSADAEDELASIWIRAFDRRAVTAAQAAIDGELALSPTTKGTEVSEGLRKLMISPLLAFFEVDEPARLVKVTAIAGGP